MTAYSVFSKSDLRKVTLTTYYFRIIRLASEFIIQWSTDGNYFETVTKYVFQGLEDDVDQFFKISGTSWFAPTGAYAEFDYIRIVPISAEVIAFNYKNNFNNCVGEQSQVANLLYPFEAEMEQIYLQYPFLFQEKQAYLDTTYLAEESRLEKFSS